MPSRRHKPHHSRRLLRAFRRDRSGATAVEFAIVAIPFFLMLFALLELGLLFMVQTTLEDATALAARQIRTGAIQLAGGGAKEDFRDLVCGNLGWLEDQCQSHLDIDVRTLTSYASQDAPSPVKLDADGKRTFDKDVLIFQPGAPGDIVLVRAFYRWTLISPFPNGGLKRLDDGDVVLMSAFTFSNEPYA